MSETLLETKQEIGVKQYDLSIGQKELWFIHSMGGSAQSAYNEHITYSLKGFLSVHALKKAFEYLINKHELLRTSFDKDQQGNIFQLLHQHVTLDFEVMDAQNQTDLDAYMVNQVSKSFDLKRAPLMRVSLIKIDHDEFILMIILHHIIIDGTSFSILVQDLNDFYNRLVRNDELFLTEVNFSYFDCINVEKEHYSSSSYREKVRDFSESLKGYAGLNFLTTPHIQETKDIFSGNRVYFSLSEATCSKMDEFAKTHRTTVFHVLYAVYCIFLSQYTRSQDILVGVPFANRERDLDRKIMGYFVNTLPIRVALKENEHFLEFVSRIKKIIFSSLSKQEVAFEHVAAHLKIPRKTMGQHPLIQTMFVWASTKKVKLMFEGIVSKQENGFFSKTAKFDLSLFMLEESKETITAYFEYRDALFEREIVERIAKNFTILLNNILNNPEELVQSYRLMNHAEMQRMKETYFNAKLDRIVTQSLNELFSHTASCYPQKIGLVFGNARFDYATIEERSNQWASYIRGQFQKLHGHELPGNTLIALCVDRNEDMIWGMLGILKAGAAYVPIDPKYPQERINYMISHSKASLLLTHRALDDALKLDFPVERMIYMDDDRIPNSSDFINKPIHHKVKPQDLAYVLYTSGSTGKPKGVAVSHENIICLFEGIKKQFDLSSQDVWSLFHTFCFDISVWEIWGAFLFGGSLVVIPYEITRDTKQFYKLIESEGVTVLTQTASAFQLFINEDSRSNKKLSHLRYISFVGESLKVSILRPWIEKYGVDHPKLANMYGITETTVYTNNKFIQQVDVDRGRDNIGWPLEEFSMCIMDDALQWCPVGIVGEICIGGRGLSRGYLYREDLTQEKFIKDPYASFLGLPETARLYRTGDLGRWMEDGSIEYLGRKDFQIKLRGFRIELGEIESTLGSYPGITHTSVLLKGKGEAAYLAAYYTVKPGVQIDQSSLKNYLNSFLPDYMVPHVYSELDSFPMTVNGKIDRKMLDSIETKVNVGQSKLPLSSALEYEIAAIWAAVLNRDVHDLDGSSNFFDLGGNSLLVVQMLTIISSKLGQDLSLSQFIAMPTIAMLASQIEPRTDISQKNALWKQIKKDVLFDLDIWPLKEMNPCIFNPNAILLTGATGFVGAHVLDELLRNTEAVIYCLVRAASVDDALQTVLEKLKKYKLSAYQETTRIIPVLGDLGKIKLGLSEHDYARLSEEVDAVFHVGAWVHHIYDYSTLYKTNVQSVRELLKMAVYNKNKAIHFVSTLATTLISPIERLLSVDGDSLDAYLNSNGYLLTKWVAEQLLKEAASRGIIAHAYRPGNVVGGNRGVYEAESNHTLLRLKGMLQLEKGFIKCGETVEMMPVDLLAAEIVKISKDPKQFSYNLNNSKSISWSDYLKIAINRGYRFDFLPNAAEWNRMLGSLNEENALYKLSHLYQIHSSGIDENKKNQDVVPDCIIETPSYQEMIEQQLSSLIACGFLEDPT